MKKSILKTINDLKEQGIDLGETPALFKWRYEEAPEFEIQMLIKEVHPEAPLEEDTVH